MGGNKDSGKGRQNDRVDPDITGEILTSLPGLHRHTHQLAPDQVPSEPFVEIRTGQDDDLKSSNIQHNILGLITWMGVIAWAVYVWSASAMAINEIVLAGSLWVLTFLFTIIGVPAVRRKARNRAKHD